jgi:arabinogalactan oligomer/maltooligosaccharide transport system substrate-binding protein
VDTPAATAAATAAAPATATASTAVAAPAPAGSPTGAAVTAPTGTAAATSAPGTATPRAVGSPGAAAQPGAAGTPVATATVPARGTPAAAGLTLWHTWSGVEERALKVAVFDYQQASGGAAVALVHVPSDQAKQKLLAEAAAGRGPDLALGPQEWLGDLAQARALAGVEDLDRGILTELRGAAVDANRLQGKVWGVPVAVEVVALWYNAEKVRTPPADADALLRSAGDAGLALNSSFFWFFGFITAFGGRIFDENFRAVLDQGGTAEALAWLKAAKSSDDVTVEANYGALATAFRGGRAGLIFDGPWAVTQYARSLGWERIGVAQPLKVTKTAKSFAPFLKTKSLYFPARPTGTAPAALGLARFLVAPNVQAAFAEAVGYVPSDRTVWPEDRIVQGFLSQAASSTRLPNEPEMMAVWKPAEQMIARVLEGGADPPAAVKEATEAINRANKKA